MGDKKRGSFRMKLPDLDDVVVSALELFSKEKIPKLNLKFKRPLVVGSGNATVTGKIIFDDSDAVFANEGNYKQKLKTRKVDGAVLISASGGKHAPIIAKELRKRKVKTVLLTNNKKAAAREFVWKTEVFPKQAEPYTYNTSTYLGMILGKTGENVSAIQKNLQKIKVKKDLNSYDAFYIIVPEHLYLCREMFLTKFDELFGSKISGRVFTIEQTKHAKTVVPNKKEMFIYLGATGEMFGKHKDHWHVSLSKKADYGEIISIGYYIIGQIQKQNKQWFKENIGRYVKEASRMFGQKIEVVVK